jgi:hypothetical protein
MATFTEARIRERAKSRTGGFRTSKLKSSFDVFLSHSTSDAELVLGVKAVLEDYGRTVYVDWLEDPQLDRTHVTPATAELIRGRMRQSLSLIYMHTANSSASKWMPWELGYFDGFNGAVAILPVTRTAEYGFKGQEYLGVYPYVDEALVERTQRKEIWINKSSNLNATWSNWLKAPRSYHRTL